MARHKKGMRPHEQTVTRVSAGMNRKDRLPSELLSRFIVFYFRAYREKGFIEMVAAAMTQQLG